MSDNVLQTLAVTSLVISRSKLAGDPVALIRNDSPMVDLPLVELDIALDFSDEGNSIAFAM